MLLFGVLGALVFRGVFIAIGAAALGAAGWVIYIFGAFLIFTAYRLATQQRRAGGPEQQQAAASSSTATCRASPSTTAPRSSSARAACGWPRPIFAVLLVVASTDVLFAIDSIPAIFAVTDEAFIVLAANAFAVMGLRAALLRDRREPSTASSTSTTAWRWCSGSWALKMLLSRRLPPARLRHARRGGRGARHRGAGLAVGDARTTTEPADAGARRETGALRPAHRRERGGARARGCETVDRPLRRSRVASSPRRRRARGPRGRRPRALGRRAGRSCRPTTSSSIDQAALVVSGGARGGGVAVGRGRRELATSIAFRGFAPTPTASLAGAGADRHRRGRLQQRLRAPRPGRRTGRPARRDRRHDRRPVRTYLTPPLTEGPRRRRRRRIVAQELTGAIDAVALAGGGFDGREHGRTACVTCLRDAVPDRHGADLQALLGGLLLVPPGARRGRRRARLGGLVLQRERPRRHLHAAARPGHRRPRSRRAQPTKVPQSESPANNGFHLALGVRPPAAASSTGAQTAPRRPLRLASWAPGEGGADQHRRRARGSAWRLPLTAAYRADGRLWVAWYDPGTHHGLLRAKLGNAKGAGGTVQKLGRPAGGGSCTPAQPRARCRRHGPGARRHRRHRPAPRGALDHLRPGPVADHREPAHHPQRPGAPSSPPRASR